MKYIIILYMPLPKKYDSRFRYYCKQPCTVLGKEHKSRHYYKQKNSSYKDYIEYEAFLNVINNILLFIPQVIIDIMLEYIQTVCKLDYHGLCQIGNESESTYIIHNIFEHKTHSKLWFICFSNRIEVLNPETGSVLLKIKILHESYVPLELIVYNDLIYVLNFEEKKKNICIYNFQGSFIKKLLKLHLSYNKILLLNDNIYLHNTKSLIEINLITNVKRKIKLRNINNYRIKIGALVIKNNKLYLNNNKSQFLVFDNKLQHLNTINLEFSKTGFIKIGGSVGTCEMLHYESYSWDISNDYIYLVCWEMLYCMDIKTGNLVDVNHIKKFSSYVYYHVINILSEYIIMQEYSNIHFYKALKMIGVDY